jgi:hypothetical protein
LGDLVINIRGLDFWETADLEKEIRKIIRKRKSAIDKIKITEGMQYDVVKRYLGVYDRITSLKEKKLSWEKITREFYAPLAKRYEENNISLKSATSIINRLENHERRLKMEYAKAKQIIENAEKGQFPGKY